MLGREIDKGPEPCRSNNLLLDNVLTSTHRDIWPFDLITAGAQGAPCYSGVLQSDYVLWIFIREVLISVVLIYRWRWHCIYRPSEGAKQQIKLPRKHF